MPVVGMVAAALAFQAPIRAARGPALVPRAAMPSMLLDVGTVSWLAEAQILLPPDAPAAAANAIGSSVAEPGWFE